jgi:hypothetical protein
MDMGQKKRTVAAKGDPLQTTTSTSRKESSTTKLIANCNTIKRLPGEMISNQRQRDYVYDNMAVEPDRLNIFWTLPDWSAFS